jgi:hypothetical protein
VVGEPRAPVEQHTAQGEGEGERTDAGVGAELRARERPRLPHRADVTAP